MHKSRSFLIVHPMKILFIILVLLAAVGIKLNAQSGLVLAAGVSMAYTDNPATSEKGKMISGFHGSLSGRIGSKSWYYKPGLELHVMQFYPEKVLNPFTYKPAMYFLKVPSQIGLRLVKADNFNLRVAGGFQFSFTLSIDDNKDNFNGNTIKDVQTGALLGAGIDLGPISIDVNFEKGLTELYTNTGYTADYLLISAGVFF